jgi:tetratricopeptide (TPR) repeat protein
MNGYIEDLDGFEKEQKVAFLNDQGTEYLKNRDFLSASSNFKKAEEISRSIGNQKLLQTCLGNLSIVALNKGNPGEALKLITEKEEICRELDLFDKLVNALLNKALILNVLNRTNESLKLAEEANYLSLQHGFTKATEQSMQLIKTLRSKL